MKLAWLAGVVGIASVVAIMRPDAVGALYEQIYPSDPVQRRALNECFTQDPTFNRLDAAAREACYRHSAMANQAASLAAAPRSAPVDNFVDRWRAAGQGRLPQNDIRAEQRH
jgi:hypothetical protein